MEQIVRQQYGKRFVADQIARAPDGMSQSFRFALARVGNFSRIECAVF